MKKTLSSGESLGFQDREIEKQLATKGLQAGNGAGVLDKKIGGLPWQLLQESAISVSAWG